MVIAFRRTANRYWGVTTTGKEYLVRCAFQLKKGWVVELEAYSSGNFCELVSPEIAIPEELRR